MMSQCSTHGSNRSFSLVRPSAVVFTCITRCRTTTEPCVGGSGGAGKCSAHHRSCWCAVFAWATRNSAVPAAQPQPRRAAACLAEALRQRAVVEAKLAEQQLVLVVRQGALGEIKCSGVARSAELGQVGVANEEPEPSNAPNQSRAKACHATAAFAARSTHPQLRVRLGGGLPRLDQRPEASVVLHKG